MASHFPAVIEISSPFVKNRISSVSLRPVRRNPRRGKIALVNDSNGFPPGRVGHRQSGERHAASRQEGDHRANGQ